MLGLSTDTAAHAAPAPRPIRGRSIAAASALVATCLFSGVAGLAALSRLRLAEQLQAGIPVSQDSAQASDWLIRVLGFVGLGLGLVTATLFLIWFHRAHRNLAAFRLGSFEHSPRGAVFSFFIPFLNLVQPYLVMREIWKASDPTVPPFDQGFWPSARTSPLLGVWWGFFLVRGLLGWGVMLIAINTHGIPALRLSALGSLAMYVVAIPSAAAAAVLILRVAERQRALAAALPASSPGA